MNQGIKFYGVDDVYSESGIDLTLLRRNLQFSPTQRLERGLSALEFAKALSQAGERKVPLQSRLDANGGSMGLKLEEIVKVLAAHGVEYVLIGGQAMTVQGSAHVTFDFDICYSRISINIEALAAALAPYHPYLRGAPPGLPFHFDAASIQAGLNFTLQTDLGEIDVLGEVSGLGGFEKVVAQSDTISLFDIPLHVLSLEGLIAAKKAAGRRKDQNHILELEELKKIRDSATP